MCAFIAQQPATPLKDFDIADGFAITLILMLFMVLGGVALVARRFRRRELRSVEDKALDDLIGRGPQEARSRPTRSRQVPSSGRVETSWERDGDWWKTSADRED